MEKNANSSSRHGRVFELIGGHPALDLVNTLDWRFRESGAEELLTDYEDLLRFMVESGLMSTMQARRLGRGVSQSKGQSVLGSIRELREATAEVLYAAVQGSRGTGDAMRRLEALFQRARSHQKLGWNRSKLIWEISDVGDAEFPLWVLSLEAEELLTSESMQLLRECGNEECRWLFLDTSKNHTRRWCDMKVCGNRMKARRFKAQLRAETAQHITR